MTDPEPGGVSPIIILAAIVVIGILGVMLVDSYFG